MPSADKPPPAPVEVLSIPEAAAIPVNKALMERTTLGATHVEANVDVKMEKPVLDAPKETTMSNIFSEIQHLAGTGPSSLLFEVGQSNS